MNDKPKKPRWQKCKGKGHVAMDVHTLDAIELAAIFVGMPLLFVLKAQMLKRQFPERFARWLFEPPLKKER